MLLHPDNPIPGELKLAGEMCQAVASGSLTYAWVAGPPGIRTKHLVQRILRSSHAPFIELSGAAVSTQSLTIAAHTLRFGGVLLLDIADSRIARGSDSLLDLMARLLSPEPVREIANTARVAIDGMDSIPASIKTRCRVIRLTSINLGSKLAAKPCVRDRLSPLLSHDPRPITLSCEKMWVLDYILWEITENNLLRNLHFRHAVTADVLHYLCDNAWQLDELSPSSPRFGGFCRFPPDLA